MNRLLLMVLLLICFNSVQAAPFVYNILGYQYQASSVLRSEILFEKVIANNPLINDHKQPEKGQPVIRKQENRTGVFFISILLLYVFASVRLMFAHQFSGSFAVLKNMNDKRKAQTETDNISSLSFYALYLITVGYISYFYLSHYQQTFNHLPAVAGIMICILFVTVLYALKTIGMYLVAWTFDKKQHLNQYTLNVSVIYKSAAIVLFPLSIMILVSSDVLADLLMKLAILIFITAVVIRYIRNLGLIKKLLSVHFLHFFVYLCAFEIMPLILLYKWIR
ncbi:MAG: DUF4271 domain-containing protein [Chitinophagaceae bacterium]|nr:DUF4271 domain-containing protein [Chitinophagaceae bacterium]